MSLTFAVGAIRMARRGVLAQQLNAIESLASADVICLDKTGTLTEARLRVIEVVPADGVGEEDLPRPSPATRRARPTRNATLDAIARLPGVRRGRRWRRALLLATALERGPRSAKTYLVLGAPELFSLGGALGRCGAGGRGRPPGPGARRGCGSARGRPSATAAGGAAAGPGRPSRGAARRTSARRSVPARAGRRAQGALRRRAGHGRGDRPRRRPAVDAVEDGGAPGDPAELAAFARRVNVVGRISPEGKRAIVEALRGRGATSRWSATASTTSRAEGLAARPRAGHGAQMAESVADLVLVKGDFAAVPAMIHEGRQTCATSSAWPSSTSPSRPSRPS